MALLLILFWLGPTILTILFTKILAWLAGIPLTDPEPKE